MHRLELLLGLLAAIAFLAAVGRRLRVADPIVFALGGLVLAVIPQVPDIILPPDVVLLLFLPPLIYAAARNTSWHEVRTGIRPILFLAVGLVLATIFAVAAVVRLVMPEIPWGVAFILGAIVGPPDAVAATSIAGSLRLPRSIVEVLEGEGLFNDVTALVAFQVALGVVFAGTHFRLLEAAGRFGYSGIAAIVAGLLVGWAGHKVLYRLHNSTSEVTITLLEPFAAYVIAERLHASGVMAVLALALYQSNLRSQSISSTARLLSGAMWEMIDFLLTGFSFILMGLQLPRAVEGMAGESVPRVALLSVLVCAAVLLVRPLWIFGVGWLTRPLRPRNPDGSFADGLQKSGLLVVSWAGMRGVISLALALSLPTTLEDGSPFPGRGLVIVVTFATIFVTLVGQGLTLPILIRRLGVQSQGRTAALAEMKAQLRLARAAQRRLDEIEECEEAGEEALARVRKLFTDRIEAVERRYHLGIVPHPEEEKEYVRLLREMVDLQHEEIQAMRREGEIDTPTANRLQRRLDATERLRLGA
jgi:CPA1 family monovalent cation:H+ antiporter